MSYHKPQFCMGVTKYDWNRSTLHVDFMKLWKTSSDFKQIITVGHFFPCITQNKVFLCVLSKTKFAC